MHKPCLHWKRKLGTGEFKFCRRCNRMWVNHEELAVVKLLALIRGEALKESYTPEEQEIIEKYMNSSV